ncbi:sodium:proton exchanger [Tardibacter chloracetimidivorans]|uniref:Sodium:proton exchanger n=1 Tax=Tardibacter chloracetimidivorans TaxID=1921510 RepID=A0A1L3ZT84_9SPHN|nr:cation:proton antiporter [Tardibacter chloracetimidivorans]API58835.1 sodium:proton exchanger [Tardibacter chloracetimidivorans]
MALPIDSPGFRETLVVLGSAGLVIPAFHRLRVNPVIGFILVGLFAGPYGLGALTDDLPWVAWISISDAERIEPFAEIGIILLLFSIGLELSFRRLWDMRQLVFGIGSAELLLSSLLIGGIILATGSSWQTATALGLALALSSTALVLPMVGTQSPVGRASFSMLLFEDVMLVPIIFALGVLGPLGGGDDLDSLFRVLWMGGATVIALLLLGRMLLPRLFRQAARTKNPELFLSAALLVIILASMATTLAGLSPIVGALLAGLLIAETEYRAQVEVMTEPFKGLALGVFLITVGMSLDLPFIISNWPMLLLATVGVLLLKALVTSGLLRLIRTPGGVSAEVGLLMASPSETTLIVLAAAQGARLIGPDTASFWQVVTAIGLTATPLLARLGRDVARRVDSRSDAGLELLEQGHNGRTVIIGFGRVGRMVAQMLERHGKTFIAVDADADTVRRARNEGYPIVFGDVARPGFVEKLDLGHAASLVLTMDNPVQNVATTARARENWPELCIVARARDSGHAGELYRAGATDAVPETLESSLQLSEAVLVDLGVAMGPVIASIHERRAELREEIKALAPEMDRAPSLQRRRLRDAAGTGDDPHE